MLLNVLLAIQFVISAALVLVILLQRSEGGALGLGGGPSGFMTARGAGNLLTRITAILAGLFFLMSISLTIVGNIHRNATSLESLKVNAIDTKTLKAVPAPKAGQPAAPSSAPSLGDLEAPVPQVGSAPAKPPVAGAPAAASSAPTKQ